MSVLPKKYQHLLHRSNLTIRIPNAMVPAICALMECKHDSPRAVVMRIIKRALDSAMQASKEHK